MRNSKGVCRLQGGKLLWIAPSGGRDRPNAEGTWLPAPFDAASVDLMRYLIATSKRPGHLFPLAMHSGEMMPPPATLDKSVGERRLTFYVGVGVSLIGACCMCPTHMVVAGWCNEACWLHIDAVNASNGEVWGRAPPDPGLSCMQGHHHRLIGRLMIQEVMYRKMHAHR